MKKTFDRDSRPRRNNDRKFGAKTPWKKNFSGRDDGRAALHTAICSKCGEECAVPFKPNGKKPVFCKNCFKLEGQEPSRGEGVLLRHPRENSASGQGLEKQIAIMNNKLDIIIDLLGSGSPSPRTSRSPRAPFKRR